MSARPTNRVTQARRQIARLLFPLGIFSLVVNLLLLVVPLYMLQIYDRVLPTQSTATLTYLSIIAVGALVVLGLLEVVRAIMASRAATRMEATLGADALVVSMMSGRATQGDIQPLRDLSAIKQFISSRAIFNLIDLPFAPLFIAILWLVHPALFFLTLAGAAVLLGLALFNQWLVAAPQRLSGENSMTAQANAQSLTRNSESLRAMGMIDAAVKRWGTAQAESMTAHGSVDTRNAVMSGLSRTIRMGLQIAILGYGAWLVLGGEMTAGMIFASSIISGRALQPIDQVIGGWRQYVSTWSAWKRVSGMVGGLNTSRQYTPMPEPKGILAAENVLVRNPQGRADQPILDRVSMRMQPGQALAVLGPSGSGKSTLARVLIGAVKPDMGGVRLDGTELHNWDPGVLGTHIGYVAQEVELLPGTIASNIARLDPQPDPDKLQRAAERANVMDLIKSLPGGFDTPVGPGGMGLSGGERQRIALARAFYGDPKILVLDEPNASLDEQGEMALHVAVISAKRAGATVIMVSQRDLPLPVADAVLHIVDGRVDYFGEAKAFYDKRAEFRKDRAEKHRERVRAAQAAKDGANPAQRSPVTRSPVTRSPVQAAPSNVVPLKQEDEPAQISPPASAAPAAPAAPTAPAEIEPPAPKVEAEPAASQADANGQKPERLGPVARKRAKREQSQS